MNRSGFTLIESLIYITCATLICLLAANFVSNIYINSKKNIKYIDRYFELYQAHNFIISYLQTAYKNKSLWHKFDRTSFIFNSSKNNLDINFFIDSKSRLLKNTGKFNKQNNSFTKSGYSIICKNCDLEFIPFFDNSLSNIMGCDIIIKDKNNKNLIVSRFISFSQETLTNNNNQISLVPTLELDSGTIS